MEETNATSFLKLPEELTLRILTNVCDLDEEEFEIPNEQQQTYMNRYRRSAKVIRRVCRFWKYLVDSPSNFYFRVTTACLTFSTNVMLALKEFRVHVELSRSMLALRFNMMAPKRFLQNELRYSSAQTLQQISLFFAEVRQVVPLQRRLVNLQGEFMDQEFLELFINVVELLDESCALPSIFIKGPQNSDLLACARTDLAAKLGSPHLDVGRHGLFFSRLSALRQLCVSSDPCLSRVELPQSLTTVEVTTPFASLRGLLENCGELVSTLHLVIKPPISIEDELAFLSSTVIDLPSLKQLSSTSNSLTIENLLTKINCPDLERAYFSTHDDEQVTYSEEFRASGTENEGACVLPSLKVLSLMNMIDLPFYLLTILSLPHLEHFTISSPVATNIDGSEAHKKSIESLANLRFRSLRLSSDSFDAFPLLACHLNLGDVRVLEFVLADIGVLDRVKRMAFTFTLPRLKFLSITAKSVLIIVDILTKIFFGTELESLQIEYVHDHYCPTIEQMPRFPALANSLMRKPSLWERYVESNAEAYNSVKHLLTTYPRRSAQSKGFLANLLRLCRNAEIVTLRGLTVDQILSLEILNELRPKGASTVSDVPPIVLPRTSHLIFETDGSQRFELRKLLDGQKGLENALSEFFDVRRDSGVEPLKQVTITLVDPSEFKETMETVLDCGLILRVEIVNKPTLLAADMA